jgi:hypothetical protein
VYENVMTAVKLLDARCNVGFEVALPRTARANNVNLTRAVASVADDDDVEGRNIAELAHVPCVAPGTTSVDGVEMRLFPLRVAQLFRLLAVTENAAARVDESFVSYLETTAPVHDTRAAPPSSTAAAATVEEEMSRAVALLRRSNANVSAASASVPVSMTGGALTALTLGASATTVTPLLTQPSSRATIATTANLSSLDLSRFHLSECELSAVVTLVRMCVNLRHVGMVRQRNAMSQHVVSPLLRDVARSHPSLTSLDLDGTFVEWSDLQALLFSLCTNTRLTQAKIDYALCECPPTLKAKLERQLARNAEAMRRVAVAVRGSFDPAPFAALVNVSRDDLAGIHVPWQQ